MPSQNNRRDDRPPEQATPVKTPRDLSRDALADIVANIQGRMYLDLESSGREFWNPGKEWSCVDVCQDIQEILNRNDLVPGDEQPYEGTASGAAGDVGKLVELAAATGLEPEDLDDLVHQCAGATASAINNSGLAGQIEFLLEQLGPADVEARLSELVAASAASAGAD